MPSNNGRLAIGSPLSQKKNITQNKQHLKKKIPLDQLTTCLIVLKKNQTYIIILLKSPVERGYC